MQKWLLISLFVISAGTVSQAQQPAESDNESRRPAPSQLSRQSTASQASGQSASTQAGPMLFSRLTEKLIEEVQGAELSADGNRIFYTKGRGQPDFFLVSAGTPPKPDEGKLDFKRLEVKVDPRAEWKQMHREAWRIMRDWFYDPNHHGQDLADLERHYGEYLPNIVRRSDLNSLMNRMLGHISVYSTEVTRKTH